MAPPVPGRAVRVSEAPQVTEGHGALPTPPRGVGSKANTLAPASPRPVDGAAHAGVAACAAAAAMGNTQAPGGEDRSVELRVQETEKMKRLRTAIVKQENIVATQQALVAQTHQLFLNREAQEKERVGLDEAGKPKRDKLAHAVLGPLYNTYSANKKRLNEFNLVLLQNKHRLAFEEMNAFLIAAQAKFPSGAFPPNITEAGNRLRDLNQEAETAFQNERIRQQLKSPRKRNPTAADGAGPSTPLRTPPGSDQRFRHRNPPAAAAASSPVTLPSVASAVPLSPTGDLSHERAASDGAPPALSDTRPPVSASEATGKRQRLGPTATGAAFAPLSRLPEEPATVEKEDSSALSAAPEPRKVEKKPNIVLAAISSFRRNAKSGFAGLRNAVASGLKSLTSAWDRFSSWVSSWFSKKP